MMRQVMEVILSGEILRGEGGDILNSSYALAHNPPALKRIPPFSPNNFNRANSLTAKMGGLRGGVKPKLRNISS